MLSSRWSRASSLQMSSSTSLRMQAVPSLLFELELEDHGLEQHGRRHSSRLTHLLQPLSSHHAQLLQDATALAAPWLASCRTAGPTSHTTPTSSPRKPNISSPGGSISSGSASACEVGMYAEQLAAKGYTAWLRTGTAGGCSDYPVMRHTFVVVALPHDAAAGQGMNQDMRDNKLPYGINPLPLLPSSPISTDASPEPGASPAAAASWCNSHLVVVDPRFKDQFAQELRSERWQALWGELPQVFVGSAQQLADVVELLAAEMAAALEDQGRELPPWRRAAAMVHRWLPTAASDTDVSTSNNLLVAQAPAGDIDIAPSGLATALTAGSCSPPRGNSSDSAAGDADVLVRRSTSCSSTSSSGGGMRGVLRSIPGGGAGGGSSKVANKSKSGRSLLSEAMWVANVSTGVQDL